MQDERRARQAEAAEAAKAPPANPKKEKTKQTQFPRPAGGPNGGGQPDRPLNPNGKPSSGGS
jgi:hypothetical protein